MSEEAVNAFYRLEPIPTINGTALYVLYYLAWRHNSKDDVAYPSLNRIVSDLKLPRQTLLDAIKRLENARLIHVQRSDTRGRGRTNRYRLPWLQAHLLDLQSEKPIEWHAKRSGRPDLLENEKVRWTGEKGQVDRQKKVRSTALNNINNNNNGGSYYASKDAGCAGTTAADVFARVHALNQANDEAPK